MSSFQPLDKKNPTRATCTTSTGQVEPCTGLLSTQWRLTSHISNKGLCAVCVKLLRAIGFAIASQVWGNDSVPCPLQDRALQCTPFVRQKAACG